MLVPANIFQPLIDVFESVLKFFHNSVGVSWGWSIVLLTICVRAALVPLTVKQFKSMQSLQRLQPQLKALQAKYKDDKQRQQQELMKFYKENKVNPLGSCLPLVLQLPVFISLFYMLRQSLRKDICPQVQLQYHLTTHAPVGTTVPCGPNHGASFLFIPDLTNKASGAVLVTLIVLYVGTQLASSLMMSSPTMDKTQRQIMMFMPLIFVVFIINFPAGVIVYWITTNTWTIGQQYVVKRMMGPPAPLPGVPPSGDGPGGGGGSGSPPESNGSSGGIGALLRSARGKSEDTEKEKVGARSGTRTVPPPPPRKKKKRSGRRR
jgi:YidC/Oxa1 family membrane protein insertase